MDLIAIVELFQDRLLAKYAERLLPSHLNALRAILRCRTPDSGELHVRCTECGQSEWRPLFCGHRSCPGCQNHEASQWLDRQQAKLLPVPYFMATFTLPYEFRSLVWKFQSKIYAILFDCEQVGKGLPPSGDHGCSQVNGKKTGTALRQPK